MDASAQSSAKERFDLIRAFGAQGADPPYAGKSTRECKDRNVSDYCNEEGRSKLLRPVYNMLPISPRSLTAFDAEAVARCEL